jgi:tetrahydromethanopterin S-methyltransferase subunit G
VTNSINETISGKFDELDLNELYSRVDSTEQKVKDFTKHCQNGPVGPYLKYIGTSSTIRDLVSLGDAIVGKGEPIDYWGVSYGTVIGFNFINSEFLRLSSRTL